MLSRQIRVTAEQLDEIVMLQLMNRFQRPVPARHVKIGVDHRPVFPVRRKPPDHQVQDIFLVPQLVRRPELNVQRIVPGHLERPISIRQFPGMQHDVGLACICWRKSFIRTLRVRQRSGFEYAQATCSVASSDHRRHGACTSGWIAGIVIASPFDYDHKPQASRRRSAASSIISAVYAEINGTDCEPEKVRLRAARPAAA